MKNALRHLLLLAAAALAACSSGDDTPAPVLTPAQIAGTWRLVDWTPAASNPDGSHHGFGDPLYVYLVLTEQGRFTLYQNVASTGAAVLEGNFTLAGSNISGTYGLGRPWSYVYRIGGLTDTRMTWTATSNAGDVSVYERCTLPGELAGATVEGVSAAPDGAESAPVATPASAAPAAEVVGFL